MKMAGLALTAAAVAAAAMTHGAPLLAEEVREPDRVPDRLSVDRDSPFFDDCYRRLCVRLNGIERLGDVQEYCMSEGWIDVRRRNGKGKFLTDREGNYLLTRLTGNVLAYFKDNRPTRTAPTAYRQQSPEAAKAAIDAAAAKRARRAAKLAGRANA